MNQRKLYNITAVLVIISTLLAFSSCIKEDLSECPPRSASVKVRFAINTEDDETGLSHAGVIEKATLYIFDRNNRFVAMSSRNDIVVSREYELDIDLAPDIYNFVVWVGEKAPYYTLPAFADFPAVKPGKEESTMNLDIPANRIVDFTLPRLLFSKVDNKEITGDDQIIDFDLIQNTNTLIFTVNGLERTDNTYSFSIADDNGSYDFDNNYASCKAFQYTTGALFPADSDVLDGTMTVLRLGSNRNPRFTLVNKTTGETLYPSYAGQQTDLIQLILKAYEGKTVNFDRRHTFHITLDFDTNMEATVTVDGWNVNDSGNELYPDY